MNKTYQKSEEGELPESYEASTFATPAATVVAAEVVEENTLLQADLRDMVKEINRSHANAERMREAVISASRVALLEHINLGLHLQRLTQLAASRGLAVGALYADYRGNENAREHALKLCGGLSIPFSYATGRKCIALYQEMRRRMVEGGMNEAEARRVLADHAARLSAGDYSDPINASERVFGNYLTASTLRQAYLELAPSKPAPTPGEVLDAAAAAPPPASWNEQRAKVMADFGGIFSSLNTCVTRFAAYISTQDRFALADQLELEAKRLRGMQTQEDIPGLLPGNK